jgi:DNA-binding NarL/FixJ family response regulator
MPESGDEGRASRGHGCRMTRGNGSARLSLVAVDDCTLYREGVIHALVASGCIDVVHQGGSVGEALRIVYERRPDLVLLGFNSPNSEFDAVAAFCSASPSTKVIVLVPSVSQSACKLAVEAGARAFVPKCVTGSELVQTLKSIHEDGAIVTIGLAESARVKLPELTRREQQIFARVARGESNKEIARVLRMAEKTVKQHITRLFQKLKVRNRVEAAVLALKSIGTE